MGAPTRSRSRVVRPASLPADPPKYETVQVNEMAVHSVEAKIRVPAQEMEHKLKASADERVPPVDPEDGYAVETKMTEINVCTYLLLCSTIKYKIDNFRIFMALYALERRSFVCSGLVSSFCTCGMTAHCDIIASHAKDTSVEETDGAVTPTLDNSVHED